MSTKIRGRRLEGKELRRSLDSNDQFISGGHQLVQARSYKRQMPDWAKSQSSIRKLLLRSFPKLETSPRQRSAASRWAMVINLYFTMGYTRSQIAEEMGTSEIRIIGVLRSITRASRGQSANGTGVLGRKRGRPRKIVP